MNNGRLISSKIPIGAKLFLSQQTYCVLGVVSKEGDVWAWFCTGPDGFATMDDTGSHLCLQMPDKTQQSENSAPFSRFQRGDQLGLLFIELSTRRRLRVNGKVSSYANGELNLSVAESFPNCPKFIQRRELIRASDSAVQVKFQQGEKLDKPITNWITEADTFFVASAHPDGRTDVSHRGGKQGFIELESGTLDIPDYRGNSLFGTLGNFALNPAAGLVFVDFEQNRQLQLTGDAQLDLDDSGRGGNTGGTGRWWSFTPRRWQISSFASFLRLQPHGSVPF